MWVVQDISPFVQVPRVVKGTVSMTVQLTSVRTVTIDGTTYVRAAWEHLAPAQPVKFTVLWEINPKNRLGAYRDARSKQRYQATRLNTDFRPWRQRKYFDI